MFKKAKAKIDRDNERGARAGLLEDLFYDFNRSRAQVYKMNFIRGIFFGFGSVLGGTLLVALVVAILNAFGGLFPAIAQFVQGVTDALQSTHR